MPGKLTAYLDACDDPECCCIHARLFFDDDDKPPGIGMCVDRGEYYPTAEYEQAERELIEIATHWQIELVNHQGERRTSRTLRELWARAGERWRERDRRKAGAG